MAEALGEKLNSVRLDPVGKTGRDFMLEKMVPFLTLNMPPLFSVPV